MAGRTVSKIHPLCQVSQSDTEKQRSRARGRIVIETRLSSAAFFCLALGVSGKGETRFETEAAATRSYSVYNSSHQIYKIAPGVFCFHQRRVKTGVLSRQE